MTAEEAQQTIQELTKKINHYNYRYYQENASDITDYDFDQLLRQLSDLEPLSPSFSTLILLPNA